MNDPATIRLLLVTATFLVAGTVACALGAAVRRGLTGGAALRTPVCRHCRSLVRGSGTSVPERCSECGQPTTTDGALRWVTSPRRTVVSAFLGAAFTVAIAVAAIMSAVSLVPGPLATPAVPAAGTASTAAPTEATEPRIDQIVDCIVGDSGWQSLSSVDSQLLRSPNSRPPSESIALLDGLLARNTRTKAASTIAMLAIAIVKNDASSAERIRASLADVLPRTRCLMTPCVHPGAEVTVALWHATQSPHAWMSLSAVRVRGELQSVAGSSPVGALLTERSSAAWRFTAPVVPGTYEVEVDWWADWPLRMTGTEADDVGLLPQRETTRRTLTVTNDPERITQRVGLDAIDLTTLAEPPYLAAMPNGSRAGIWFRIPSMPVRCVGTWSIETNGAWVPLIERTHPHIDPFDVLCSSFVDSPRGTWPDRLRVRFAPSTEPIDALPSDPSVATRLGGVTPARALDAALGVPFELTFKRSSDLPTRKTYQLETVRDLRVTH